MHGQKTGTNLHAALHRVNEMISSFRQNRAKNHFNETQNIIIIETDGKDVRKCLTNSPAHKKLIQPISALLILEKGRLEEPYFKPFIASVSFCLHVIPKCAKCQNIKK